MIPSGSRPVRIIVALVAVWCLGPGMSARSQAAPVLVFAAASLQTAIDELTPAMTSATGVPVKASYAASSALAKQIENGAPADIFVSADLDWMDYLAERQRIRPESRVNLLHIRRQSPGRVPLYGFGVRTLRRQSRNGRR